MIVSLYKTSSWFATRKDIEHIDAGWMISPVSNWVTALVGPMLDPNYVPAMQFFYIFSFISYLLLSSLVFYQAVLHPHVDDRRRPLLAVLVAAPAVGGMAYLTCFLPNGPTEIPTDFIFLSFFWISVSVTLWLLMGLLKHFFGRATCNVSYWAAGFPAAALSLICTQYASAVPGGVSRGIAYAALASASAICASISFQVSSVLMPSPEQISVP